MQWVRKRRPIARRDRVAVSLDHLPAGPAALALELEEVRVRGPHERGGPGVAEDMRREASDPAPLTHALEDLLEAIALEEGSGAGGEQRIAPVGAEAALAEVAVELASDRVMEVDDPAAAELARLGPDGDRPIKEIEVGDPQLAELVQAESGAGGEDEERVIAGAGPAGGPEDPEKVAVAQRLADVLIKLRPLHMLENAAAELVREDAVLGEKTRQAYGCLPLSFIFRVARRAMARGFRPGGAPNRADADHQAGSLSTRGTLRS